MTQRFGKFPKYLGNGLDAWDTALVNDLNILNMAFGRVFTMLEMT